jgi:hypothetical protein
MHPVYGNVVHEYKPEGNGLAQCMERTTMFGWRCYSWVLLVLLTALVGVSVALGVVVNEPRSKCLGKRIVHNGSYDPLQHCLTWSFEGGGVMSMSDGICPNECDQELYNTHMIHSSRRLQGTLNSDMIYNFCDRLCGHVIPYGPNVYDDTQNCISNTCSPQIEAQTPNSLYDIFQNCTDQDQSLTTFCGNACTSMSMSTSYPGYVTDINDCTTCCDGSYSSSSRCDSSSQSMTISENTGQMLLRQYKGCHPSRTGHSLTST